jgi:hypothetical protein
MIVGALLASVVKAGEIATVAGPVREDGQDVRARREDPPTVVARARTTPINVAKSAVSAVKSTGP